MVLDNHQVKLCGKNAKYTLNNDMIDNGMISDKYFCEKHALQNTDYLIPKKESSPQFIKKLKKEELVELSNRLNIDLSVNDVSINTQLSKPLILSKVLQYYENKCFKLINDNKSKSKGCADIDLITIGRNMRTLLDNIPELIDITHVIIENQISPLANRMKTIQGMLAQYFIMGHNVHIEFISSVNKLKNFGHLINNSENIEQNKPKTNKPKTNETINQDKQTEPLNNTGSIKIRTNPQYKKHKLDGIFICSQFLKNNENLTKWDKVLLSKKKDDYADSFLQGIWYLKYKNIITYAENLNINSI